MNFLAQIFFDVTVYVFILFQLNGTFQPMEVPDLFMYAQNISKQVETKLYEMHLQTRIQYLSHTFL